MPISNDQLMLLKSQARGSHSNSSEVIVALVDAVLAEREEKERFRSIGMGALVQRDLARHEVSNTLRKEADDFGSSYWPDSIRREDVQTRLRARAKEIEQEGSYYFIP